MTTCRIPDCGATTDGFVCKADAAELRRALQNHHRGDPDLPTLMAALSQAATGSARVYRANRRPGQTDQTSDDPTEADYLEAEFWRTAAVPSTLRTRDRRVTLPSTGTMVNLAARGLLDEAWNTLTTTVRHLCETRGIKPPEIPTGQPASERIIVEVIRNRWRITREPVLAVKASSYGPRFLADWLADRVNAIRYDETGPDIHADLTRLRERLIRAVDRGPSRVYAGPCEAPIENGGRCNRPLYASFNPFRARYEDDEYQPPETDGPVIICDGFRPAGDKEWDPADRGCGAEHTASDRREWLIADLSDRLETLMFWTYWWPFLVPRLHWPARSTWWKWTNPARPGAAPRLQAKSLTRDAEELYRGGDLLDLVAREQPRIRGNTAGYARRSARSA